MAVCNLLAMVEYFRKTNKSHQLLFGCLSLQYFGHFDKSSVTLTVLRSSEYIYFLYPNKSECPGAVKTQAERRGQPSVWLHIH